MKREILIYNQALLAAKAAADLILEKALIKNNTSSKLNIAVSGGSTPKQLFQLLSDEDYRNQIPWHSVRFFWVDERCVEPTHPESNFGMTYDALLQFAFVPSANIFRMKGEDIPENEAERYAALLRKEVPFRNGFPVFDIILLGMGDDGHTASIFPDNLALLRSHKAVDIATHPINGQKRITLTGNTLNNAEHIVFLITGSNKANVLTSIMQNSPEAQQYPAAHIGTNLSNTYFYLDKEAAKFL